MTCTDCLKNCGDTLTTDKCVRYTGPDVPILGICEGDSLFQVEQIILDQLVALADGTGILLSDITLDCDFITLLLDGQDKTVANLVQTLISAACQTKEELDALSAQVNASFSVSGACLTLPSNPTRDQVLQAIVTKLCTVSAIVDLIYADYVKASQLCTLVTACIGGGSTQEYTKMPKYVALPYHGPLSAFDGAGKGIAAFGYDKVYICNGQTVGTFTLPDYRGRSPMGSNYGVPGSLPLDSAVDPSLSQNAGYSLTPGTKKGAYTDTLTSSTIPAHTHAITDPGHSHNYTRIDMASHPGGNNVNRPQTQTTAATTSSTTGITIGSTGGSQPHNNTQPSIGTTFIMYVL